MRILSGEADETIVINGSVRVTVLDVRGTRVRLGVEDPGDAGPTREEGFADGPVYASLGATVDPSDFEPETWVAW